MKRDLVVWSKENDVEPADPETFYKNFNLEETKKKQSSLNNWDFPQSSVPFFLRNKTRITDYFRFLRKSHESELLISEKKKMSRRQNPNDFLKQIIGR